MDGNKAPANVRAQFRHGLAYAVFPAAVTIQLAGGDLESYRALYRQYVPAIEELSKAGWEPVPYATADGGVIVERFGGAAGGELHFTLRNYADKPVETLLRPGWQALGCPDGDGLVMLDILPGTPRLTPFPREGCRLSVEADGSRAIWIGTRRQAAQHGFRRAAATLEKTERLFRAEMRDGDVSAWKRALQLATAGAGADEARALATAGEAPPPGRNLPERPEDRRAGRSGKISFPSQGAGIARSGGAGGRRGRSAAGCRLRTRQFGQSELQADRGPGPVEMKSAGSYLKFSASIP